MLFRPWLQENEVYTYRAKELKRLVRTPATLFFAMCRPTFVLIDIVGRWMEGGGREGRMHGRSALLHI